MQDHEKLALFHNNHVIFLTLKGLKNPIRMEKQKIFPFFTFAQIL